MQDHAHRAIAIVGVGAVLPDAPSAKTFWNNVKTGKYSITETPPDRWDPALYWDPDPKAPDKTYSKIGGWVRDFEWDPLRWKLPIPPRVSDALDRTQKWAIISVREALADFGYPQRPLDPDRTAVILGNAMAGDRHYLTALRAFYPEFAQELTRSPTFQGLSERERHALIDETLHGFRKRFPEITEDTMPGELANVIAGRVAAIFDFHGPNYVCDAACASAMAAFNAAIEGLEEGDYDVVITGGVDSNMSASSYIKFCKIGALSASGTRPYDADADGFVMGEGAAIFMLKRLEDAEAAGDKIYAVVRGIGGSSDGKGKGITAPNPVGQRFAVERAWVHAGVSPATCTMIEGHGTSTRVGDVVEVTSVSDVFKAAGLTSKKIPIGSVKSNIGHLKGAAGAAGILKAALSLHEKVVPPSLGLRSPNPKIEFDKTPFYVNTELRPWTETTDGIRRVGISAFGFGGTNFHTVLEEFVPGRIARETKPRPVSVPAGLVGSASSSIHASTEARPPLRGLSVLGARTDAELLQKLEVLAKQAGDGTTPERKAPSKADISAPIRLAIDYADAKDLAKKTASAIKALTAGNAGAWKVLRAQGVFRGTGPSPKVAFLYTGQGSQYVNMLAEIRESEPIVRETFEEADRVMTPLLGKPLSEIVFVPSKDLSAIEKAEEALRQTAITQPAVLTVDAAMTRLMAAYGITPDIVMGHSLGEYGALVAAGVMPFGDALEAVSARGREMTKVSVADNGLMAAVIAPIEEVERVLQGIKDYVVIANINSPSQAVIGGSTPGVMAAVEAMKKAGHRAIPLNVSHAFHTSIVAPASKPLMEVLRRLSIQPPAIPVVANVTGELYPMGPGVEPEIVEMLGKQIAAPVQFVKGLKTLYQQGARVFVEMGPKKALHGFVEDVLSDKDDVLALFTNHPKISDAAAFNQALAGLYSLGIGHVADERTPSASIAPSMSSAVALPPPSAMSMARTSISSSVSPANSPAMAPRPSVAPRGSQLMTQDRNQQLGALFAEFLERGMAVYSGVQAPAISSTPVVISGVGVGLPGGAKVFNDDNVARVLRGDQFIDVVPVALRNVMVDRKITRLVKTEQGGGPRFETITSPSEVIRLAGRAGEIGLAEDFGYPKDRMDALDSTTELAIAVGVEALRDAGIPLIMHYKTTTKGTKLPDRWGLPEEMRDDTGVIFGAAFPGYDNFAKDLRGYYEDHEKRQRIADLESLRGRLVQSGNEAVIPEVDRRIRELKSDIERHPYNFDRRFIFRVLAMGHSQFAEYIGARGPNTCVNAACASGTHALAIAEDWIRLGRCKRVIIITADNVTSDNLMGWLGSGFLASGAAATDEVVAETALPFDRRRHGLVLGMGAAAMVVESADSAADRGLQPICQVLGTTTANSAYHGSRLNVDHICQVMEKLIRDVEARHGIDRRTIARNLVFVSHETYTPARGGSAQAEVFALRTVFGDAANQIVIANTKGMTGHAMGTGIEDVAAIKMLETGVVPPVPNFKEIDPELGQLNLSQGGAYPVQYALRLGAGFGSQIAMSLVEWIPTPNARRQAPDALGYAYRVSDPATFQTWLKDVSGYAKPELEVSTRTLRFKDQGPSEQGRRAPRMAAPSPVQRLAAPTMSAMPSASVPDMMPLAPSLRPAVSAPSNRGTSAAPMPAAPASSPAPAPAPAMVADSIEKRVLEIVSQKTGYPPDMLDLELDLEADLGIDTVKQAETFAAVREAYNIPRQENMQLRDFPTMKHVIQFVKDRRPDLAAAQSAPSGGQGRSPMQAQTQSFGTAAGQAPAAPTRSPVTQRVLAIVAEKTGYPPDMLDLDLDLEADLGIDTVKQAETFAAVREAYDIPRQENMQLRDFPTMKHVIQFVLDRRPDLAAGEAAASAPSATTSAPVGSVASGSAWSQPGMASAAPAHDEVTQRVLSIVAEKTGYPPDMLDLDLDLEADLGIDTVKQAETFAAVREAYDIPRQENMQLRDFPTMKHVIQFVRDRRPDLAPAPAPVTAASTLTAGSGSMTSSSGTGGAAAHDDITRKVLEIVAEKTGYPPDMLDLDLDLEADLGIDTVKQAETFAAVRTAYNIPREENMQLRDFPTMKHVIQFVRDRLPAGGATKAGSSDEGSTSANLRGLESTTGSLRRVPLAVLRPSIELFKPTGVELGHGSRVVVVPDQGGVGKALIQRLEKMGVEVLLLEGAPDANTVIERLNGWAREKPVHGVYWLPALDHEGEIAALDAAGWKEAVRVRVKLLYTTMRALYEQVAKKGTFLISATRLGGRHGYDQAGAVAPMGGAVTGFTKTYKREKPEALVKAVDFEQSRKTAAFAECLIAETLRDPGVVEVGYVGEERWTVSFDEKPMGPVEEVKRLGKDTVFVVTGAAGSIVSAIIDDLARASGGVFHLLDLTPKPDKSDADLALFRSDKEALKRTLFDRIKAQGERATPAMVEKQVARLERSNAALVAIEAVERAGGTAHYHQVNLLDGEAVARVVEAIRTTSGRMDVLLHAAGLEISHFLPDKKPEEYDLVFDVKADGWFHLLKAAGDMPIGSTVVFSSIAGRFGNGGQTDYSAANDLLCKYTSSFQTSRPSTRGIAIDWTAWAAIGMASRGSIPKMMELAGIDMLPPEAGIPAVRRELVSGFSGEVVIGGRLGILLDDFDASGGLDVAALNERVKWPMTTKVTSLGVHQGLRVETTLDPKVQPFLFDHQIDGTPVLPGVMGVEAFGEITQALFPSWHVVGLENVQFLAPFKFYRNEPRSLSLFARFRKDAEEVVADCSLVGARTLKGQDVPQLTTHFVGSVRLAKEPVALPPSEAAPSPQGAVLEKGDVYQVYFHGPAYQVLEKAWRHNGHVVGQLPEELPVNHRPEELETVLEPRLVELCFQTAGVWQIGKTGKMGLPMRIDWVSTKKCTKENVKGRLRALITAKDGGQSFDAVVVDEAGTVFVTMNGYRTAELPGDVDANKRKPLASAMVE